MSRGSGTTRDMKTWVETVNKEDKCVRPSRDSTRPVPRIFRPPPRARTISRNPRRRGPALTLPHRRHRRITKKSEKYFFDRDKVKWVEWEKEAEAFKAVAGEEAKQKKVITPPPRVESSARWIDGRRREAKTKTRANVHRAVVHRRPHTQNITARPYDREPIGGGGCGCCCGGCGGFRAATAPSSAPAAAPAKALGALSPGVGRDGTNALALGVLGSNPKGPNDPPTPIPASPATIPRGWERVAAAAAAAAAAAVPRRRRFFRRRLCLRARVYG